MVDMQFAEWVRRQLVDRDWSQGELARRMGMTPAAVSYVMNEGRNPGPEFCRELARAFRVPEIVVFVQAGLMSETTNTEELTLRELYAILSDLPVEEQRAILAEARARYRGARRLAHDPATSQ